MSSENKPKLYKVAQAGQPPRLIRAMNRAGALGHAAKTTFVVSLADPFECATLGKDGVVPEDATAKDPEPELDLGGEPNTPPAE